MSPALSPGERYAPPDLAQASMLWGACCGQGAVAAILRCPLAHVRRAFPWAPREPWTNPKRAVLALEHLGAKARVGSEWPTRRPAGPALVYVQILGPWMERAPAEAHTRSHVAVYEDGQIYDVNVGDVGGWTSPALWKSEVMPELVALYHEATGFRVRRYVDVLFRPAVVPAHGPFLRWDPAPAGPQLDLLSRQTAVHRDK
jgi:hypothetical protein